VGSGLHVGTAAVGFATEDEGQPVRARRNLIEAPLGVGGGRYDTRATSPAEPHKTFRGSCHDGKLENRAGTGPDDPSSIDIRTILIKKYDARGLERGRDSNDRPYISWTVERIEDDDVSGGSSESSKGLTRWESRYGEDVRHSGPLEQLAEYLLEYEGGWDIRREPRDDHGPFQGPRSVHVQEVDPSLQCAQDVCFVLNEDLIAVAATVSGTFSLWDASWRFLWSVVGGIGIGLVAGECR